MLSLSLPLSLPCPLSSLFLSAQVPWSEAGSDGDSLCGCMYPPVCGFGSAAVCLDQAPALAGPVEHGYPGLCPLPSTQNPGSTGEITSS
jgi:hypothetical protein